MSQYFLGIDGGQSSTVALIANEEGKILGRGSAGPCIHVFNLDTENKFRQVLEKCLGEALSAASLPPQTSFASACLGLSGGTNDKDRLARQLISARVFKITHDAEIALTGATGGAPGIIVIAGTGSMAFGRNKKTEIARAGGWGHVFGDEGGAFDIARQALRCSLRFEEGWGPATALHAALLVETGCDSAGVVLHSFYEDKYTKEQMAQFARTVSLVAEQGDEVAQRILEAAATALAGYTEGVFHHLFTIGDAVTICPVGGVFQNKVLRRQFTEQIESRLQTVVQKPLYTPVAGAVLEAMQLAGVAGAVEKTSGAIK